MFLIPNYWMARRHPHRNLGSAMGSSWVSTAGLIRNLTTGYVTFLRSFHVVFDDWFATVTTDADRTPSALLSFPEYP